MKTTQVLWMDRVIKRDRNDLPKRLPRKIKKFNRRLNADPGKRLMYMFERAVLSANSKSSVFGKPLKEDVQWLRDKFNSMTV